MTQEALKALGLYEAKKQSKKEFDDICDKFPLTDRENPKNPINNSILDLRKPYVDDYMEKSNILSNYLDDHFSVKDEFQAEIDKLNAKIKAEKDEFDKDCEDDYKYIEENRLKYEKIAKKRGKLCDFGTIGFRLLKIFWVIAYLILLFTLDPQSTMQKLLIEGILIFGVLPVIGFIFLGIFVNSRLDVFHAKALHRVKFYENEYLGLQEEKEESVAHLKARVEDFQHLVHVMEVRKNR